MTRDPVVSSREDINKPPYLCPCPYPYLCPYPYPYPYPCLCPCPCTYYLKGTFDTLTNGTKNVVVIPDTPRYQLSLFSPPLGHHCRKLHSDISERGISRASRLTSPQLGHHDANVPGSKNKQCACACARACIRPSDHPFVSWFSTRETVE